MKKPNGYSKDEKLKNKKDISLLFEHGKWYSYKELSIISLPVDGLKHPKLGVSVSKRYFKKAVDRNRIKRLLRETYRLNKELFIETFGANTINMLFYRSYERPNKQSEIEDLYFKLCKKQNL